MVTSEAALEQLQDRNITARDVAVNAVMAGCRPEYLPVVLAALQAMCRGNFNIHGASVSTGGSAQLLIINGPIRHTLGLNSGSNLFGPGCRPNATIGRAIRLIHINVLGNRPGEVDMSCLGHPGKFTPLKYKADTKKIRRAKRGGDL